MYIHICIINWIFTSATLLQSYLQPTESTKHIYIYYILIYQLSIYRNVEPNIVRAFKTTSQNMHRRTALLRDVLNDHTLWLIAYMLLLLLLHGARSLFPSLLKRHKKLVGAKLVFGIAQIAAAIRIITKLAPLF